MDKTTQLGISPEKIAGKIMKIILYTAFTLIAIGVVLLVLGINKEGMPTHATVANLKYAINHPSSFLFFYLSAGVLLLTPILVTFATGVVYIKRRQVTMAVVSGVLFIILLFTILASVL